MFGTRLGGLAAAWYTELELGSESLTLETVRELFMNRYCPLEEGVHEQAIRWGRSKLGQPRQLTLISYMASFKDQVMKASHNTGAFVIPKNGNFKHLTKNMRRLYVELPPSTYVRELTQGSPPQAPWMRASMPSAA